MIAALLTLATQPQTVTFTHPCAHSSVVLEKLGEEIGVPLKPGGSVLSDYFLVSFNDVPVQEALDKVATALHATWEEKSGTRYLTRTKAQELEQERQERKQDAKVIADWLAKRKIEGDYTADYAKKLIEQAIPLMDATNQRATDDYQKLALLEDQSPAGRFLTRILHEIGPETLADLGENGEVQYVFNPTPLQRRLPNGEAARLFEKENDLHKLVVDSSPLVGLVGDNTYYSGLISPYRDEYWASDQTTLTIGKEMGSYYSVRFSIKGFGSINTSIPTVDRERSPVPDVLQKQEGTYTPAQDEAQLSKAILQIFGDRASTTKPEIGPELTSLLRDPVANEPLTTFGSTWLLQASKALNRNIVALLSDDAVWASVATAARGPSTFSQMWTVLPQMDKGYEFTVDDKWITLVPSRPVQVRSERVNREDWKRLINTRIGDNKIETLAAYAILSDNDLLVMLATIPGVLTGQDIDPESIQQGDRLDALRIFGYMSLVHQKSARNGGAQLALTQLSNKQMKYARKIVFGSRTSLVSEPQEDKWGQADVYQEKVSETDPTVRLARGTPNGSVLNVYIVDKTLLYQRPQSESYRTSGYSVESIASNMAAAQIYPEHNWGDFSVLGAAKAEQLVLEFAFPGVGVVYSRVQFDFARKDMVYVRPNELPEPLRSQLDAAVKRQLEIYRKAKDGGGG